MANASMIPARVEPCLETFTKISPGSPLSYSPTVTNPLHSATRNSKVRELRVRGIRFRTGSCTTGSWTTRSTIRSRIRSTTSPAAAAAPVLPELSVLSFLVVDSGWATLQLSR